MELFSGLKKYFLFSFLVFSLAFVLGIIAARLSPDTVRVVLETLQEKFAPLQDETPWNIFLYIFGNNTLIDFLSIITFFLFGLVPLYILLSNGFSIGIIFELSATEKGIPLLLAALAPHGVIELPAFFIATGAGLWLSVKLIKKIFKKEPFKENLKRAVKIFFFVIIPLNFIAALIETYITPIIIELLQ